MENLAQENERLKNDLKNLYKKIEFYDSLEKLKDALESVKEEIVKMHKKHKDKFNGA